MVEEFKIGGLYKGIGGPLINKIILILAIDENWKDHRTGKTTFVKIFFNKKIKSLALTHQKYIEIIE
jgi:hypothetical protein